MPPINLQGRTILITRPQPEAQATAEQVRQYQGIPLLAPALTIVPARDSGPMQRAMARCQESPSPYRGILVTSANGARAIVNALPPNTPLPPLFAVGEQSAAILRQQGWSVHTPPAAAGGERLAEAIIQWETAHQASHGPADPEEIQKKLFLFPQAEQGREELAMGLQQAGYTVEKVAAYRAEPGTTLPPEVETALAAGKVDAVLFFSGRTAQATVASLPAHGRQWLANCCIAAISPVTAEAIRQLGFQVTVIAQEPNSLGLLTALHRHWCGTSATPCNRKNLPRNTQSL
ncbi:MAG: uroporphyrinogen-III synthase [Magnetococcus sp. XQGC-1]